MKLSRRSLVLSALVVSIMLYSAIATAGGFVYQVARSTEGFYATADVFDYQFGDGTSREFRVVFVVPRGSIEGTHPAGPADLRRPWAFLKQIVYSDPTYQNTGREICRQFVNPINWSEGSRQPGPTWGGVFLDIACDDNSGYLYYRVKWEAAPLWSLATNPVVLVWDGAHGSSFETSAFAPVSNGFNGHLQANAQAHQNATVTICGYRETLVFDEETGTHMTEGAFDCQKALKGGGKIVPINKDMFAEVYRAL